MTPSDLVGLGLFPFYSRNLDCDVLLASNERNGPDGVSSRISKENGFLLQTD